MGYLTRDQILGADDRDSVDLDVPEWGGVLKLRAMSGHQVAAYSKAVSEDEDAVVASTLLISMCAVDEAGDSLFSQDDLKTLGDKSLKALERVAAACMQLNKMNVEVAAEELKAKIPANE